MAFGQARKQDDRRVAPRRRVLWGSFVAAPDGSHWSKCQTQDISPTGARVAVDEPRALPASVWFLEMRHRLAYEAEVVWRKAPEVGLQFLKVYRFDEVPNPPLREMIEKLAS